MSDVRTILDRANGAIKAGNLDYAERLVKQAERMKSGKVAGHVPDEYESGLLWDAAKAIRESNARDAKTDAALQKAHKIDVTEGLDPAVARIADELHGGGYAAAAYSKAIATKAFLRGREYEDAAAHAVVLSPAQMRQALDAGLTAREIKATMIEVQDTLGGFLLSGTVSEKVMVRASTTSVVRSRATVDTTTSDFATFPVVIGNSDVYSSGLRGTWMSETGSGTPENVSFGSNKVPINLWRLPLRLSRSLLEDAGPRIVDLIIRLAGDAIGTAEDGDFLVGPGATRPLGILAQDVAGNLAPGIRVTNSGSGTAITADGVISTVYTLPAQYRRAPTACATCTSATLKALRLLKDGSGLPIFQEAEGLLCGLPLVESESMPQIAANAYPLLVGDFAGYAIGDRVILSVERFIDSATADVDQVLLNFRRRLGGQPGEPYRFSALKVSS